MATPTDDWSISRWTTLVEYASALDISLLMTLWRCDLAHFRPVDLENRAMVQASVYWLLLQVRIQVSKENLGWVSIWSKYESQWCKLRISETQTRINWLVQQFLCVIGGLGGQAGPYRKHGYANYNQLVGTTIYVCHWWFGVAGRCAQEGWLAGYTKLGSRDQNHTSYNYVNYF